MLLGFVSGVAVTGVVVASLLASSVTGDLPTDATPVFAHASSAPSALLASDGTEVVSFRLVEAIEPARVVPPELIDAFLFAAEPSFYEARADRATPPTEAIRRAAAGSTTSASRLSTELTRLLLDAEPPGLRRRIREEILATRLDATRSAAERASIWLEWVPLCDGHRGLQRAAADCLGVPVEAWGPAEIAAVAAAAAGGLDLGDPPDVLLARRDAVVDKLVLQGGLDPEAAVKLPAPAPRVMREGPDAWQREALSEARRRIGAAAPSSVRVHIYLDPGMQAQLASATAGGAWAALDPRTGGVLALGGPASVDGGALERASAAASLVAEGGVVRVRYVNRVDDGRTGEPLGLQYIAAVRDGRSTLDRLDELRTWDEVGSVRRRVHADGCVSVTHPRLAVTVCGAASPAAVSALGAELPPESPPIPDDAWLNEDGRLMRRAEGS
ncbi:MAG: hypothetical protein GY898_33910 [Proteobacteria bacterium]|nr:hypothetical protein [Pseudomonadota bacterium]